MGRLTHTTRRVRARIAERHADQEGAYVIEYLGTMVTLTAFILLVVQITMVFLNAILVNHALGLAAQEAAARGGVDINVDQRFQGALPDQLRNQSNPLMSNASFGGSLTPGNETTQSGDVIEIEYSYTQPFDLLKILGLDAGVQVNRSMKVSSQSSKE